MNDRDLGPARSVSPTALRARSTLVLVIALTTAACGQGGGPVTSGPNASPPPGSVTPAPSQSAAPSATDALTGTWDTGPYATKEFVGQEEAEFRFRFYQENGVPFVTMVGWDPSKGANPGGGDHGPYELLPGGEIAIGNVDQPQIRTLYRYELTDDFLTLTWLRDDPPGPDASGATGPFGTIRLHRV